MDFEVMRPEEIERRSFAIIEEELRERGIHLPEVNRHVVMRVIHATADFDFADNLEFSKNVVSTIQGLIREGASVCTDTQMAKAGINRRILSRFGSKVHCFMSDEEVAAEAKARGVTRATVSMERAAKLPEPVILVVGNAPTALIEIRRLMGEGWRPACVVGVPVGFVNVEAAKALIPDSGVPYIISRGRKGGSTVAAAIVNAVLYDMR